MNINDTDKVQKEEEVQTNNSIHPKKKSSLTIAKTKKEIQKKKKQKEVQKQKTEQLRIMKEQATQYLDPTIRYYVFLDVEQCPEGT